MNAERKKLRYVYMCAVVSQINFSSKSIFLWPFIYITLYQYVEAKSTRVLSKCILQYEIIANLYYVSSDVYNSFDPKCKYK